MTDAEVVDAGVEQGGGTSHEAFELGVREKAGEPDVGTLGGPLQVRAFRSVADDHEPATCESRGLDGEVETLAADELADREQVALRVGEHVAEALDVDGRVEDGGVATIALLDTLRGQA